ncbi:MAG: relaxase/mobilization nuclease domain-containing protein [Oscillospiraceae bacterium]|nr:relaxase/mobilization nuclease domain-containing protein [Oscillospiraceae bacterium]
MATVTPVNRPKGQTRGGVASVLKYATREDKTNHGGEQLVTGINCQIETCYTEFISTKLQYNKCDGKMYYHFVQSFHPEEQITPEEAHAVAVELAQRQWKDYEVIVATHTDTPHIHSHLIVNSVSFEHGKKLHFVKDDLTRLRNTSDEICMQHGLSICQPKKHATSGITQAEYHTAMRGESWKVALAIQIDDCMKYAVNKEHFIELMESEGYRVKWTDSRANITYTNPDGKSCRDYRLHEEKYRKENMEREFQIRAEEYHALSTASISDTKIPHTGLYNAKGRKGSKREISIFEKAEFDTRVDACMKYAVSKEHFVALMEREDYRASTDAASSDSRSCPENHLHEEKYMEDIEYEFRAEEHNPYDGRPEGDAENTAAQKLGQGWEYPESGYADGGKLDRTDRRGGTDRTLRSQAAGERGASSHGRADGHDAQGTGADSAAGTPHGSFCNADSGAGTQRERIPLLAADREQHERERVHDASGGGSGTQGVQITGWEREREILYRTLQNDRLDQTIRKPHPVANVSPNYYLRVLGIAAAPVLLGVMFAVSPGYSSKKHDEDEVVWGIIATAVALGIATVIIAHKLHNRYVCQTYDVDELIRDPQRVKEFSRDAQAMDAQDIMHEATIEDSDMDEQTADTLVLVTDAPDDAPVMDAPDRDAPDPEEPTMEQHM